MSEKHDIGRALWLPMALLLASVLAMAGCGDIAHPSSDPERGIVYGLVTNADGLLDGDVEISLRTQFVGCGTPPSDPEPGRAVLGVQSCLVLTIFPNPNDITNEGGSWRANVNFAHFSFPGGVNPEPKTYHIGCISKEVYKRPPTECSGACDYRKFLIADSVTLRAGDVLRKDIQCDPTAPYFHHSPS